MGETQGSVRAHPGWVITMPFPIRSGALLPSDWLVIQNLGEDLLPRTFSCPKYLRVTPEAINKTKLECKKLIWDKSDRKKGRKPINATLINSPKRKPKH